MTDSGTTTAAATGAYRIGDVIADKYRLESVLGEGGQALVFRARNLSLDAEVAIKLVHPDAENRAPTHRLLREARAAARLGHPGIVRVFDLGETDTGDPFLVMELLRGEDLAALLVKQRALTPTFAVRVLLPIADALTAAHARGMVHRDLKPANVFLAESEGGAIQPKLLDFGIVKVRRASKRPESITNDGTVIGSLAYLSPEQARGLNDIDERADIWCYCAMLYECVTGETPFQAPTYDKLLRSIVNDEPAPISERGVNDEALWQVIRRGLSKSPDDRWPSMRELGHALATWLNERGIRDDVCGVSLESRWLRQADAAEPSAGESESTSAGASTLAPADATKRTEGSFSAPRPGPTRLTRRHWVTLGGVAACVAMLGFAVSRLVDSAERVERVPAAAALPTPTIRVPEPEPVAVPEPVPPPPPPVSGPSVPVPAAKGEKPSPRVIVTKSPRLPSSARPSVSPAKRPTDLLNPY